MRHSRNQFFESYFNCTSTILDKHDKFITGFEHSCSLQQAEAVVKTILQALFYKYYLIVQVMFDMKLGH